MPDEFSDLDFGATMRGFNAGQRLFHRYALKEILGRGGMGIVWRAFDEQLERDVALKFLPEMVAFDEQAIGDLKRETKKSQELRHHHIVQVYDFVTDKQAACIAMEYVDGPTLSAIKARKEHVFLEVDDIKGWIEQLCEALAYAHQRARVVHRDLKPANLMINSKGELKVTDFGIARSVSDSMSMLTMQRGTSGTLVYMSPQQLSGERASHLDDIYAVGATIYDLLTGKPPFYSGNVPGQVENKVPPSMTERRKEFDIDGAAIPKEWDETVAACLAKDPAQRPQSAGELAKGLGLAAPWYEKIAVTKAEEKPPTEIGPARSGRRPKMLIIGAIVAFLVAGVFGGWWFGIGYAGKKSERQGQLLEQKAKEGEAARQREMAEQERMAAERKAAAEAEKERLAAAERNKTEEAKKKQTQLNFVSVTKEQPYENSLGMKFVPVPTTNVLFSIWQTRVKDYNVFVDATKREWEKPDFEQTEEHPAVNVSWEDATAFCEWLTEKERNAGRISANQAYRLPTDLEWSAAVGLKEESGSTPKERNGKVQGVYPWGTKWPPPKGAGNYDSSLNVDSFQRTSPVGSFAANRDGIYDLGGNVQEWCQDWYDAEKPHRVLRGASWVSGVLGNGPGDLLSSSRSEVTPGARNVNLGFRCVLVAESSGQAAAQPAKSEEAKKKAESLTTVAGATKEQPYENSLGMKFVPVPGTSVLFSIWETRVKDYKVFVEATKREWEKPGFEQTEEHPAVNVSWEDATAFCEWLTEKERKAGKITASQSYRLPTDLEWSAAVGLEKETGNTPEKRGMKVKGVYPWGTKYPPPKGAGNYDPSLKVDDYKRTSPAGSFEANRFGLYDMGGNVWQWCEDWFNGYKKSRVLRGASWDDISPDNLRSSARDGHAPEDRIGYSGFRCVLVVESSG